MAAATLLIVTMFSQDDIIFPTHAVASAGALHARAERLQVETPDGQKLQGIHFPPKQPSRTLVLGFGGNAWNGQHVAEYLHDLYPDAHVVTFHYRGYRPSSGRPSASALLADAPLVLEAAVERIKPERTIVVGFSIGTGVAASLAKDDRVDGLILVTPFDSLKKVASSLIPWLPISWFFEHEMDAAKALGGSTVPVAIIGAERDEVIPPPRTEALRKEVPNLVFDRTIKRAGHNDIYQRSDFHQAMQKALAALP